MLFSTKIRIRNLNPIVVAQVNFVQFTLNLFKHSFYKGSKKFRLYD